MLSLTSRVVRSRLIPVRLQYFALHIVPRSPLSPPCPALAHRGMLLESPPDPHAADHRLRKGRTSSMIRICENTCYIKSSCFYVLLCWSKEHMRKGTRFWSGQWGCGKICRGRYRRAADLPNLVLSIVRAWIAYTRNPRPRLRPLSLSFIALPSLPQHRCTYTPLSLADITLHCCELPTYAYVPASITRGRSQHDSSLPSIGLKPQPRDGRCGDKLYSITAH